MPLHSDAYYRKLAEEAVRKTGLAEPPVSMDSLAASLALPVRAYPFPAFFSGAVVYQDGLPILIVNTARDDATRRDTLAHLIGHLVVILDDATARFPKDSVFDHHEAEVVAEELIVPTFMVIEQARKWFNDYRYLARLFAVNEGDMLEKMRDLGLIQDRGILWDY